jgi:hypothetical protein
VSLGRQCARCLTLPAPSPAPNPKGSPMLTYLINGWNDSPLWLKVILAWLGLALLLIWPIARFCGFNNRRGPVPSIHAPQAGVTREERGAWLLARLDERGMTDIRAHVIDDAAPLAELPPTWVKAIRGSDDEWHRPSPTPRD